MFFQVLRRPKNLPTFSMSASLLACVFAGLFIPLSQAAWVSPTGSANANRWSNRPLAYDNDVTSYASCSPNRTGWGQALQLNFGRTFKSRRLRVNTDFQTGVDAIRLEIQLPNNAWSNIYEGSVANQEWVIIPFTATNIQACRFTYRFTATYAFWLYEVQAFEEPAIITLPTCDTLEASSVEEDTVILHGELTDDGGDLCQWRMQYGLTTLYATNTDWVGDEVAITRFSKLLVNLESNTVYHFRAQVKNEAGISSGSDMTFETGPPMTGWISPSGNSDPSNAWVYEERAYDDNTNTTSKCYHDIGEPVWSPYLYLTHSTMLCDKIKYFARKTAEMDQAEVGVLRNGAWTNVYLGPFTNRYWMESSFPEGTVTQARIRFRLNSTGYGLDYELHEFKFHRVVRMNLSGTYDGATPVRLAINGITNSVFTNFATNVYSFSVSVGANTRLLIYYDKNTGATNGGAIATLASGYEMNDLNLESKTLLIRNDSGVPLTQDDLLLASTGDTDLPYRFSGKNLIVTNGITLKIKEGATLSMDTNHLTLHGNLVTDGTLDCQGTTYFSGLSLLSGLSTPAFNHVTISRILGAHTNQLRVSGNWINNGVFSNRNGTVEFAGQTIISGTSSSYFQNVTISGSLTAPATTMGVAGNWTNDGAFTNSNGTVLFNGVSTLGGASDSIFHNITLGTGASLTAPPGSLYVNGSWDNTAGATFSHNNGTVVMSGLTSITNRGHTTFYNYSCTTPGKAIYYLAGSTQTILGVLTMAGDGASQILLRSATAGSRFTFRVPNAPQNVTFVDVRDSAASNNTITVSGGVNSGNTTNWIFAQSRYWVGGAGNWNNTARWSLSNGGAGGASVPTSENLAFFTSSSGTGICTLNVPGTAKGIILDTGTGMTITLDTNTLTLGGGGFEQKAGTLRGSNGVMRISGFFRQTGGTFIAPSKTLEVSADFTRTGGTYNNNTGTVIFTGNSIVTDTVRAPFNSLVIQGSVLAPPFLRVTSNFVNNGIFLHNGGHISFEGNSRIEGASTSAFQNITITGILAGSTNTLSIAGAWTNNGTFNPTNGTVWFNGTTEILGTSTTRLNHVRISGSLTANGNRPLYIRGNWHNEGSYQHNFGAVILEGTTTVSGASITGFNDLTLNGTLAASTGDMKIAGDFVNNGTLQHNSGKIIFNGATMMSGTSTNQFWDLAIWGSLTAPTTTLFVAGDWINHGNFSNRQGTVVFNGTTLISGANPTTFRNVILQGSTVTAHSVSLFVDGNWTGTNGYFIHNWGQVYLGGTNTQTILSGGSWNGISNNWRNSWNELIVTNKSTGGVIFADGYKAERLTCRVPGARLYFCTMEGGNHAYEIGEASGLDLLGTAAQRIQLRRYGGSGTNQWEIYSSANTHAWSVSYVDVQNSLNNSYNAVYPSLSVDSGNNLNWFEPTLVMLAELAAQGQDQRVAVRWTTASEMNNAGFHVYRALEEDGDYHRLNAQLIRGLGNSVEGRSYEFLDLQVTNGTAYYYKLESVELGGRTEMHGPVSATPGEGVEDEEGPRESLESGPPVPPDVEPTGLYKLYVREDGLHRLAYEELSLVITNLNEWTMDHIRLFNQGEEVPLCTFNAGPGTFDPGDALLFLGKALDSRFTDRNVYWIYQATNAGLRVAESGTEPGAFRTNAWHTEHFERNESYEPQLPDEAPDDDHWFFLDDLWIIGDDTDTVELHPVLQNVEQTGEPVQIRVALRGMTESYNVTLSVNGVEAESSAVWTGLSQYVYAATFNASNLLEGTNLVSLTLTGTPDTLMEWVLVNWVEVDYLRSLQVVEDALSFAPGTSLPLAYEISALTSDDLEVFKTDGQVLQARQTNVVLSGTGPYQARFADAVESNTLFVAATTTAMKSPEAIVPAGRTSLRGTTNQADYIILTPAAFHDAATPLASHRESQGLRAKIVHIEDVYDDFSYGIFTPYAIQEFLAYSREAWQSPAPRYVLLLGDGTYDYRDDEGGGAISYVPVKMLHSMDFGEVPCDNWYSVLEGGDAFLPDLFLGRLPISSTGEIAAITAKMMAYEAQSPDSSWTTNVVLVADNGDDWYEALCDSVKPALPPSWTATQVYLNDFGTVAACRTALSNALNKGSLMTVYAGHGGMDRWANEALLRAQDVRALTNSARLPFVVTPTCQNGYFAYFQEAIAVALVKATNGGAIACLSPSGISDPPDQQHLMNGLVQALFTNSAFQLGPAVHEAKRHVQDVMGTEGRNIVQTFTLFGDPALRLPQASSVPSNPTPPKVTATNPSNHCASVDIATDIRLEFSKPMDRVATRAAFSIRPWVEGTFAWTGNTLAFQPLETLAPFTTYTVTVTTVACDLAGQRLDGNGNGLSEGSPTDDVVIAFTPSRLTVQGTTLYAGGQTGAVVVIAGLLPDDWEAGERSTTLAAPGEFSLSAPAGATYWINAYRDSNGNGVLDSFEARTTNAPSLFLTNSVTGLEAMLTDPDSDGDGLPDWVENRGGVYANAEQTGTNPDVADSDDDGISDWDEIYVHGTDPTRRDTDRDGILDFDEIFVHGTDPLNCDTDGDGLLDGDEVLIYGTQPLLADSDEDGLVDGDEVIAGTSPLDGDDFLHVRHIEGTTIPVLTISVDTHTNRWYTLNFSPTLVEAPDWTILEEYFGTGGVIIFTNEATSEMGYFFIGVRGAD